MKTPIQARLRTGLLALLTLPILASAQPDRKPVRQPDRAPPPHGRDRGPEDRPQRGPRSHEGHPVIERWMRHMAETQPEEHQRLQNLRESDPTAFRQELRRSMSEARQAGTATPARRRNPFADQVAAIRAAESETERNAAVATLQASVESMVDRRMEVREQRIEAIRAQLEQLEADHNADKARRDELVQRQLERLLTDPDQDSDAEPNPSAGMDE